MYLMYPDISIFYIVIIKNYIIVIVQQITKLSFSQVTAVSEGGARCRARLMAGAFSSALIPSPTSADRG